MISRSLLVVLLVCSTHSIDSPRERIDAIESNLRLTTGARALLQCQIQSSATPSTSYQLIWIRTNSNLDEADAILTHNTDVLVDDSRLSVQRGGETYALTIENVTRDDRGLYACEMNSELPERGWIQLDIEGKIDPSISFEKHSTLTHPSFLSSSPRNANNRDHRSRYIALSSRRP